MLLDLYPEARHIICEWATENIQILSSELLSHFVREELVAILHLMHTHRCREHVHTPMTLNAMKIELNIENFGVATAWRMLKHLGFKYEPRKKSYYNDRHENIENVRDRKTFFPHPN